MPFRMYNELMGLAKESLNSDASESADGVKSPELVDRGPETEAEVLTLVEKLREVLKRLPNSNIATLKYIIQHLRRSDSSTVESINTLGASQFLFVHPRFLSLLPKEKMRGQRNYIM